MLSLMGISTCDQPNRAVRNRLLASVSVLCNSAQEKVPCGYFVTLYISFLLDVVAPY